MTCSEWFIFSGFIYPLQGSSLNGNANPSQHLPSTTVSEPLSTDISAIITSPSSNPTPISSAPTPSVSFPKPSFPFPKQSSYNSSSILKVPFKLRFTQKKNPTILDSPVRAPTRDTLVCRKRKLPEKSSQAEPIKTKVPETTCNICLSVFEGGHWVGCNKLRKLISNSCAPSIVR